jgi:hypothetical protein
MLHSLQRNVTTMQGRNASCIGNHGVCVNNAISLWLVRTRMQS